MKSTFNPYLTFTNNAREAMTFYHSIFGGDLSITPFSDYGVVPQPGMENGVMHATLTVDGKVMLMASDSDGRDIAPSDAMNLCLSGTDADELRGYWEKLSEGGTVAMPLEKQMWGDTYGACTDRFGVSWMVDIVPTDN